MKWHGFRLLLFCQSIKYFLGTLPSASAIVYNWLWFCPQLPIALPRWALLVDNDFAWHRLVIWRVSALHRPELWRQRSGGSWDNFVHFTITIYIKPMRILSCWSRLPWVWKLPSPLPFLRCRQFQQQFVHIPSPVPPGSSKRFHACLKCIKHHRPSSNIITIIHNSHSMNIQNHHELQLYTI